MERLALDTTFLIDLQNERRARGQAKGATAFLHSHQSTELLLPSVALGEYLEGFADPDADEAQALVSALRILPVNADVARVYAATARGLRTKGRLIGTNDLWIACTAKAAKVPLVTRNGAHFKRVSGLVVVEYSP
jgi:predicted nucleic acid-binding protein